MTYQQLVVIELRKTFATLCLSSFSDVFQQRADPFGVLQVVRRPVVEKAMCVKDAIPNACG